jgi:hypothetical protein
MPAVVDWLCQPGTYSGASKCAEIAEASTKANKILGELETHQPGSAKRFTVGDRTYLNYSEMFIDLEDLGVDVTGGVMNRTYDRVQELPPKFDDKNLGKITAYAKSRKEARAAQTGVNTLAAEATLFISANQSSLGFLLGPTLTDDDRTQILASMTDLVKQANNLDKELKILEEYQKEYEAVSRKVSEATKEELAELSFKAFACQEILSDSSIADTTMPIPQKSKVYDDGIDDMYRATKDAWFGTATETADWYETKYEDDQWTYKQWCKGGLTPEETAKLQGLINVKGAGISGAGKLGNVGTAIAASQEPTKRTFKEQCLLLSNIVHFVEYRTVLLSETGKRKPYVEYSTTSGSIKSNACVMADRQPWGFMNQMVQDPSFASFFDIKPQFLSQLQPMIRLYKISTNNKDSDDVEEKEVEVTFDGTYNESFDGVLRSSDKRGFGVGIQNFTFSYEGSDPFSVKKSIKAKLSIFASSFDDLLKPRGATGKEYRYADLALKTGSKHGHIGDNNSEVAFNNLAKLNFRLKAVVGWAKPLRLKGATDAETTLLTDSINNSFVTLNLTPTIHEFEIQEDGRVIFHINYLAYVDEFFDEISFNIFSNPEIQKKIFKRTQIMAALHNKCTADEEETKKIQEEMAEEIDNDKRTQLASIISQLLSQKKVYFKAIPYESLRAFNSQGPYWKFDLFSDAVGSDNAISKTDDSAAQTELTRQEANNTADTTGKDKKKTDLSETSVADINMKEYIAFFYLSDLVDIILNNIDGALKEGDAGFGSKPQGVSAKDWSEAIKIEKFRIGRIHNNFKKFRALLGPIELIDVATREYYTANIGDLPISTAYFMDWLTDKTLKRDNVVYSLPIFLKDLVNNLIKEFLNEDRCFDINIKQRIRMFQSSVTSYGKSKSRDDITYLIDQQGKDVTEGYGKNGKLNMRAIATSNKIPVLRVMGERDSPINSRGPDRTYNYAIFYAGRTQPQELMRGDVSQDAAAGIFHYVLGKDRGIVKNIQLSKTDSPGLKEVRFEQEGYNGLMQLREVYDATITCYGAPNVVPGTYIYIDPRGFAPASGGLNLDFGKEGSESSKGFLTKMGIGGYYMVIRAENTFGPGKCETEIKAKWVAELGSSSGTKDSTKRRPIKKCTR